MSMCGLTGTGDLKGKCVCMCVCVCVCVCVYVCVCGVCTLYVVNTMTRINVLVLAVAFINTELAMDV